ncbi:MAG: hypothetical protein WBB34_17465 [Xanthobacteraceae bacterium]
MVQSALSEGAQKNFDVIRRHRNKMVHFFHHADRDFGSEIQKVAEEQLRAWYDLNELLTVQWAPVFEEYEDRFDQIEGKLKGHREYLQAKFDGLKDEINLDKKRGVNFRSCTTCGFEAASVMAVIGDLQESRCLVCGYQERWLDYTCPNCEELVELKDGGTFKCSNCDHKDEEDELVKRLNEFEITKDNYFDAIVPANCSDCEGYHTVVEYREEYLCVVCFSVSEVLKQCGWCSEYNNGDMSESSYAGCSVCDGSMGWHARKDD